MRAVAVLVWVCSCAPEAPFEGPREESPAWPDVNPRGPDLRPHLTRELVLPAGDACVSDAPARFLAIREEPQANHAARNDGVLPWPRYTSSAENGFGIGEHFQGIQRVGDRVYVSGGVAHGEEKAQIIAIDVAEERVVGAFDLDTVLWHAGGMQISEGVVAVALMAGDPDRGELRFYDLDTMSEVGMRVVRERKLYAAAIARDGERFVAVSWDDEVLEVHTGNLDQWDDVGTIDTESVDGFQEGGCGLGCGSYQSINLVRDCAGALFLVATRNTNHAAPTAPGDDLASLYALSLEPLALTLLERRALACGETQCNFAAAAGVHVDGAELAIYGAYHWLEDDALRFVEFGP